MGPAAIFDPKKKKINKTALTEHACAKAGLQDVEGIRVT